MYVIVVEVFYSNDIESVLSFDFLLLLLVYYIDES